MSNLDLFIAVTSAIIVILLVTQVFGKLITYIGQPKVVGEMISGVLLGPTCFGYFFPAVSAKLFSGSVMPFLFVTSNLGLSFYMFLVGAEMDTKLFRKKVIRQSGVLSAAAIVTPFIFGIIAAVMYKGIFVSKGIGTNSFALFMGTAFAITAFPMMARILQERKLLATKVGTTIMLSASMQDVTSWILLAFLTAYIQGKGLQKGIICLIGAFILVTVLLLIVKPFMAKIGEKVEKNNELSSVHFSIIIFLLLACALITDHLGLYSVFGGFMLGLTMPSGKVFQSALRAKMYDFTVVLLLPLFFTYSGLNANMLVLGNMTYLIPCIIIVAFSFFSKYVPCLFAMRMSGYSWAEASAMGGLTNARGLMELIVANIGLIYGVITKEMYSILILIAITTTIAATPIYNGSMKIYDSKKRKKYETVSSETDALEEIPELSVLEI